MGSGVYATIAQSMSFQSSQEKSDSGLSSFFNTIPPERIGLNGEYDHSGLAKRVDRAFCQHFQLQDLEQLCISQRGRVVILTGRISNRAMLDQLVQIALHVMGATAVETYGVRFIEPLYPALELTSNQPVCCDVA